MRILIATFSAEYEGRLDTQLATATRLLIIKSDGTFLIHADTGSKPYNWMSPPTTTTIVNGNVWIVHNVKTGERLTLTFTQILSDTDHCLGEDYGVVKDGAEEHLQKLLAANPNILDPGFTLVRREYPTPVGPVDLMCLDEHGTHVAVEVKRRGGISGVEQLSRYISFLNRDPALQPVHGVYAAQTITPQARVLAEDRGYTCVILNYDEMKGTSPTNETTTLF